MMYTVSRLLLVIAGAVVTWCSLLIGNKVHFWWHTTEGLMALVASGLSLVLGDIALVAGAIALVIVASKLIATERVEDLRFGGIDYIVTASICSAAFGFVFTIIVGPFGVTGAWITLWDFLLVLGLIPTLLGFLMPTFLSVLRVCKILLDIVTVRKTEEPMT